MIKPQYQAVKFDQIQKGDLLLFEDGKNLTPHLVVFDASPRYSGLRLTKLSPKYLTEYSEGTTKIILRLAEQWRFKLGTVIPLGIDYGFHDVPDGKIAVTEAGWFLTSRTQQTNYKLAIKLDDMTITDSNAKCAYFDWSIEINCPQSGVWTTYFDPSK